MPHADPVHVEGLRNDHVVGALGPEMALLAQPLDPGEAAALFVHTATDFDGAGELHPSAPNRFDRDDGCRNARLHVTGTPPEDLPVGHHAGEGVDGPARAGRHHVDVTVQVDAGALPIEAAQHIHPRMARAVVGMVFSDQVLHGHARRLQAIAQQFCALAIVFAGRVDRGNSDQLAAQLHHLFGSAIYLGKHPLARVHSETISRPWRRVAAELGGFASGPVFKARSLVTRHACSDAAAHCANPWLIPPGFRRI